MGRVLRLDSADQAGRSLALTEAARVTAAGGILAMPTESFYALGVSVGCSARQAEALRRLCLIKGRPEGKPLLVLIGNLSQLPSLVAGITPAAEILMRQFWPGPLTIVFPAASGLPDLLTGGTGTIGVRLSASAVLKEVLGHTGPLTGTSANRSGQPPARTAGEVETTMGEQLDIILDGGAAPATLPSTIVDTQGPLRLLREGPISREQLESALAVSGMTLSV